ncbi:MAG: glycosyltransferase [Gemmatimonadaceae bacterium]
MTDAAWRVGGALWLASYPAAMALLTAGLRRLPRTPPPAPGAACPSVTIVVSARNEAAALPRCLEALLALDYPRDRLQLVLVNDRSTDETGALLEAVAQQHPHITAVHTEACADNGLEAKARGVAQGIARATGEWVLITDADAAVPRGWVHGLLRGVTAETALVGGVAMVEPSGVWWGRFERAAWSFLQVINMGAAGWGMPVVSSGPDMGVRLAVYRAAGGLERARFRIAEDLAIFRMGRAAGGGVRLTAEPATTVLMTPVPSPAHVVSQLRRWVGGALESGPAYRIGVPLALGWGVGLVVMLLTGWRWWPAAWGGFAAAKLVADLGILASLGQRVGQRGLWRDLPALWAVQVLAMLWLPLSLMLDRRIHWRGDGYAVRY